MALRDYWDAARAVVREGSLTAFGETLETRREEACEIPGVVALTDTELEVLPWPEFVRDGGDSSRRPLDDRAEPGAYPEAPKADKAQERYTREVVDPISGREYTVNVSPYSWGYKYEVRDNESGEVLRESNMQPNLNVAMEDAQSWIENRHNEIHPGGFAADGRWIDGREDDDEMER